jgi:hypothetical protein
VKARLPVLSGQSSSSFFANLVDEAVSDFMCKAATKPKPPGAREYRTAESGSPY